MSESKKKQALDGARFNGFYMDPNDLVIVGLDTEDGEEHALYCPRIHVPLDDNMVRNVIEYGIIQPIVVRKNADGKAEVVMGRTRVRWARAANEILSRRGEELLQIPCVPRRETDDRAQERMFTENAVRQDDDPITKAKHVVRLMSRGRTEAQCAVTFGVSELTIRRWLSLLDLIDPIKKAVAERRIGETAAAALAAMPLCDQASAFDELMASGGATVEKVARIKRQKKNTAEPPPYDVPSKHVLKRALKAVEGGEIELDETVVKVLKCLTGQLHPSRIAGLTAVLHHVTKKDEESDAAE